jgi:hypothetical protein
VLIAQSGQSLGAGIKVTGDSWRRLPTARPEVNAASGKPGPHLPKRGDMDAIKMKTSYKIYASGKLKAFLNARASGAPKELLMQLSAESLAEQEARLMAPKTTLDEGVIDFQCARRERAEPK